MFAVSDAPAAALPARGLAIGTGATRVLRPEEIGRVAQIEATAAAVSAAMVGANISHAEDFHYVQVKCPPLTAERVGQAAARGQAVVSSDSYKSLAYSRGASALGVALALDEVGREALSDSSVCQHNEVIALGDSESWASDAVIAHRVMRDAIDLPAAMGALADAGLAPSEQLDEQEGEKLLAVLVKADPWSTGRIRGAAHHA